MVLFDFYGKPLAALFVTDEAVISSAAALLVVAVLLMQLLQVW